MNSTTAVAGVLLTVFVGCGGASIKGTSLVDEVHAYNDGVRWSQYPKAAARIHPKERTAFVAELSELEGEVRISEWEMIHLEYPSSKAAKVHVRYTWHRDSEGLVHETNTVQAWKRFGRRWLMIGEERVRGEPIPYVEEPDDEEGEETGDSSASVESTENSAG